MKMKEMCSKTGLTERTIRYYEEEKLIAPLLEERNGRRYRNYTQDNLNDLQQIVKLRKAFFTISEIREMKESPEQIPEILKKYHARLQDEVAIKSCLLDIFWQIDAPQVTSVAELCRRIEGISQKLPLPQTDISPNYGRFDDETPEEKERAYQEFLQNQVRLIERGRVIVLVIALVNVFFAAVNFFRNYNFLTLFWQIGLAVALYCGVRWVKYLYVVGAIIGALLTLFLLFAGGDVLPLWSIVLLIATAVLGGASGILLIKSEAVRAFLYAQKK